MPYRLTVTGCGGMGIAGYHVPNFLQTGQVELVGCCDIDLAAADRFAARFGGPPTYRDQAAMLAEQRPDIVLICTNETLHAELTIAAAQSRPKAILCEKPMAMNLGQADAMLAACAAAGTRLIIGHQRRYYEQYARAKRLLDEGAVGELVRIEAWGHPGSSLMVDGTHLVDLIRFYAGEQPIAWVMGQIDDRSGRRGWGHRLEDAALGLIGFAGRLRALVATGGQALGGGLCPQPVNGPQYLYLRLEGTAGAVEVFGDSPPPDTPPVMLTQFGRRAPVRVSPGAWDGGRTPQAELVDVLERGGEHPLGADSARATLEALMAVYAAAKRGNAVTLPLEHTDNPFEPAMN